MFKFFYIGITDFYAFFTKSLMDSTLVVLGLLIYVNVFLFVRFSSVLKLEV